VYNVRAFGANGNGVSSDSPVRKLMCLHCSIFQLWDSWLLFWLNL
jgi:hypothetical protein